MRNFFRTLILLGCILFQTGCGREFLDQSPDERVEITTLDQVLQLISTAYSSANYGWICELSSDNIIDVNAPYKATQSNGTEVSVRYNLSEYDRMDGEAFRFEPVRSSKDTDSPAAVWEGCYHAIAVANHAQSILDEMVSDEKKKLGDNYVMPETVKAAYAEIFLTRAYHHFILVNLFCQAYKDDERSAADIGIPYSMTPEDVVSPDYDRSNVTETYRKIGEDLEKGLAWVSDINYKMPKWHFNVNAAHAFAARYYLYRREYEKAMEHADFVLGTDYSLLQSMLRDYSVFEDCITATDFAEQWQNPDAADNLMLMVTYSTQFRRQVGYRYATAGKALRDIDFHLGPNWNWFFMPAAVVAGETFYDGTSDHGYVSCRIAERFEYTDKVSGIGYAHIVRREFTSSLLLLERAEARLLGRGDVAGCVADLVAYEESRQSFSKSLRAFYTSGRALRPLTQGAIEMWYTDSRKSNVISDWSSTQDMSPDFVIPTNVYAYMNCLNDMRRYETAYTGLRFFDLKRFGIVYSHFYGPENTEYKLDWNDPRRAIEVPQDVMAAGLSSSREEKEVTNTDSGERHSITPFLSFENIEE